MTSKIIAAAVLALLLFSVLRPNRPPPPPAPAARPPAGGVVPGASESWTLGDFEQGLDGWQTVSGPPAARSSAHASRGDYCLAIPARPEREAIVSRAGVFDWFGWHAFAFDVYAPAAARGHQVYLAVKDGENTWYQSREPFTLEGGRQTCVVNLTPSANADGLVPAGHYRPWSGDAAHSVREIQIRFQGKTALSTPLYLDRLELLKHETGPAPPLFLSGLQVNQTSVEQYGKFEVGFRLSREYHNPFNPEEIEVTAFFTAPGGRNIEVPGFFYQPYDRSLAGGREQLLPAGRGYWMVRFAPRETGTYRYSLRARDGRDTLTSDTWRFTATPSARPGFVRVSQADPRYFEFSDGSFFYPIGLNIVSPWDRPYGQDYVETPPIGLGTYAYDHYLARMQENGLTFFRMWMAHWWLSLEWTPENGPFHGIGRYSSSNAWRLDHILEEAEARGVHILLTFNNHTMLTGAGGWPANPYNTANGGFLARPGEYFTDPEARALFRRKLRYIAARWGYSSAVFAWDFWSEVDLTGNYNQDNVRRWHEEMSDYLKATDPFGHLVTTHFCYPSRAAAWRSLPGSFDFLHSNAYVNVDGLPGAQPEAILEYWRRMGGFNRPTFVSEYGGHWALSEDRVLARDLHTGLWAGFMTPLAASPQFWWWNFVDDAGLYSYYRALARFAAGEDRRGRALETRSASVENGLGRLSVMALGNRDSAYAWIYNFLTALRVAHETEPVAGAQLVMPGLDEGRYRVEFWDTRSGLVLDTLTISTDRGILRAPLPDIENDLACKIKALSE